MKNENSFLDFRFKTIKSCINSKIIIFSASKDINKSILAKYLAYKHNGIYLNLANMQIGDNTFDGTLIKNLGVEGRSQFVDDLNAGKSILVIDAIDEAEMVSGIENLENFLIDIDNFIGNTEYPSVFLFSEFDTAKLIKSFFINKKIPFSFYEVLFTRNWIKSLK